MHEYWSNWNGRIRPVAWKIAWRKRASKRPKQMADCNLEAPLSSTLEAPLVPHLRLFVLQKATAFASSARMPSVRKSSTIWRRLVLNWPWFLARVVVLRKDSLRTWLIYLSRWVGSRAPSGRINLTTLMPLPVTIPWGRRSGSKPTAMLMPLYNPWVLLTPCTAWQRHFGALIQTFRQ